MRLPKTWVISDTHFFHAMLVEKGYRPADYQEQIIHNWKRIVASQDTVLHLGDVIFARASTLGEIMADLPGVKILVRGNHTENRIPGTSPEASARSATGFLLAGCG